MVRKSTSSSGTLPHEKDQTLPLWFQSRVLWMNESVRDNKNSKHSKNSQELKKGGRTVLYSTGTSLRVCWRKTAITKTAHWFSASITHCLNDTTNFGGIPITMYNEYNDDKKGDDVIQGVAMDGKPQQGSGASDGHTRYYCEKCQSVSFFSTHDHELLKSHQLQLLDLFCICIYVLAPSIQYSVFLYGSNDPASISLITHECWSHSHNGIGQPYDLPHGATSWRCTNCMTFNSTTPAECPCCTIQ